MKNRRKAVQPFEIKKRKIDIFRNYEANGFEKSQRKFENFSTLISKKSNRLCCRAQDQLGINLSSGKEAVVFLSKTRKICKIVTTDEEGTMLLTRTLYNGRFEELMVRVGQQAKCSLTLSDLERFLNGERLYTKGDIFW